MDTSKVVTVEYYISLFEAEVAHSLLESFGIHSALVHADLTTTLTSFKTGQIYVELIVNEDDAIRAREILAAGFDRKEFAEETEALHANRTF